MSAPPHRSTQPHMHPMAQDQRRNGLQGHESLHRQLPRESRVCETARRPPRHDTPRGHPRRPPRPPGVRSSRSAVIRGLTDEQRGKGLDRCRARGGRAPLRSWECCAAPSPERQCGSSTKCSYDQARPAGLLTGDRGGAYAHRGEIHGTRRHSIRWHLAPGRGHVPRGRSAARPRQ